MAVPAGPVKHPVVIIIDMALKVLSLARFQAIFLDGKNGNAAFPSMLKKLTGTSSTAAITRPDLNIRPRMGVDVPMGSQVNMPTVQRVRTRRRIALRSSTFGFCKNGSDLIKGLTNSF